MEQAAKQGPELIYYFALLKIATTQYQTKDWERMLSALLCTLYSILCKLDVICHGQARTAAVPCVFETVKKPEQDSSIAGSAILLLG